MRVAFLSAFVLAVFGLSDKPLRPGSRRAIGTHNFLIDINAKYSPEDATSDGVKVWMNRFFRWLRTRTKRERPISGTRGGNSKAVSRRSRDPLVKQDIQILIDAAARDIRASESSRKDFPFLYGCYGRHFLWSEKSAGRSDCAGTPPAALIRMKKYTGIEPGYTPIMTQAEEAIPGETQNARAARPVKDVG